VPSLFILARHHRALLISGMPWHLFLP
jgi:hypothetical protein